MQARDALELALGLALAQRGAEAGDGDGDEERLGDRPESGEPEDPGIGLVLAAAVARQHNCADKAAHESDEKCPGSRPRLGKSGQTRSGGTLTDRFPLKGMSFSKEYRRTEGVPIAKTAMAECS